MKIVYIAVAHPRHPRSRTGHAAALAIEDGKITDYESVYHTELPFVVRKSSWRKKISGHFPVCHVESYENDLVMRGQSWHRFDNDEKENERVPELLEGLPTDEETREKYRILGQYEFFYRLPDYIDADKFMREIKAFEMWSMFSPLNRILFDKKPAAHNCCSAMTSALDKARGIDNNSLLARISPWINYSLLYLLFTQKDAYLGSGELVATLFIMQAIYFAKRAYDSVREAIGYASALRTMMKGKPGEIDYFTLTLIYTASIAANLIASPAVTNLCDRLFVNPPVLERYLNKMPGVERAEKLLLN